MPLLESFRRRRDSRVRARVRETSSCRANLINFRACIFYSSDSIEDATALERNVQRHGDGEFSTSVSVFFFSF